MSRTNDELSIVSFHESDHSDMEEQQDDPIREEFQQPLDPRMKNACWQLIHRRGLSQMIKKIRVNS